MKKTIAIVLSAFLLLVSPVSSIKAQAAAYTVTAVSGVLYSCEGTEVFADADPATFLTTLKVNTPVVVTGSTSNGYWQISMNNGVYYVTQQSLSVAKNTFAYRQLTMDAKAALVGSPATGKIMYAQGANDKLEPASTTKIMTALLVIEAIEAGTISLDTPVMVTPTALASLPKDASHVEPRLVAGEVLTVSQLLQAVMISSDCQACNVLAELVAGSVPNFVALMNARAAQLGAVNTNFTNPSGYPDKLMYTNAMSLYMITANAIKHPLFNQYFGQASAILPPTNLYGLPRPLVNTNDLMVPGSAFYNPAVTGSKTGTASRAGQCLVTVSTQREKTVITVLLGAKTRTMWDGSRVSMRYYETNRLIDMGFKNYY